MRKIATMAVLLTIVVSILPCISAWGLEAPNFAVRAVGPNQVNLSWQPVSNPGYGYMIEIRSTGDQRYPDWTRIAFRNGKEHLPYWVTEKNYLDPLDASTGEGSPCQYPVFGLKNNTPYQFRIRSYAKDDEGIDRYSHYSENVTATTANYDVRYVSTSGDDSNNGLTPKTAWRHIQYAGRKARPGTVVYIMPGHYARDYLIVSKIGTRDAKIVFQGYPGGTAMILSGHGPYGPIVHLRGRYTVVDGLVSRYGIDNSENWLIEGDRNAVVNCEIGGEPGAGYATLVKITGSHNLFHNNYAHDVGAGPDANHSGTPFVIYSVSASHPPWYNVVQYNHFSRGAHDTGLIKGNISFTRYMNNLHDGGWGSGMNMIGDSNGPCSRNLVEGNEIVGVRSKGMKGVYKVGIGLSGDYNTLRRNIIRDGAESSTHGIELSRIAGQGATGNLVYNNVIYGNRGAGIRIMDVFSGNNVIRNNISYCNGLGNPFSGKALELASTAAGPFAIDHNIILHKSNRGSENPDYPGIIIGDVYGGTPRNLAYVQSHYTGITANHTIAPSFIAENGNDFHLKSTSKAIDAGTVVHDEVWGTLSYKGKAPDIGAFEFYNP